MAAAAMLASLLLLLGALLDGLPGIVLNALAVLLFVTVARVARRRHRMTRSALPRCLRWIP